MPGRIQAEIQRSKPFQQIEEEAFLNIERTADLLAQRLLDLLRPYELTSTQYNVLRILRGAGPAGLNCKDIGSRMITREPDITRLLDRLEKRTLISRTRSTEDRRHLNIQITEGGLSLLAALDNPVTEMHATTLNYIGHDKLEALITTLEEIRAGLR